MRVFPTRIDESQLRSLTELRAEPKISIQSLLKKMALFLSILLVNVLSFTLSAGKNIHSLIPNCCWNY